MSLQKNIYSFLYSVCKVGITFLILCSSYLYSQNPQWIVYTHQNSGLPSNNVQRIGIDTNNIKWVGTDSGLVKINGNIWTIYKSIDSVKLNRIWRIYIDKKNNLWIGTIGSGILKYNGANWTKYDTINSPLISNYVCAIFVDYNNIKWFGTLSKGLMKYNDTSWILYNTTNSGIPSNFISTIYVEDNIKWIGTFNYGLGKLIDTTWTNYNTNNSGISGDAIHGFTIDIYGYKWVATEFWNGLSKYNSDANQWTIYSSTNSGLPENNLLSVITDSNKRYVGTLGSGLAYLNDTNWTVYNPENSPLPGWSIGDLDLDRYKNLWICNSGGLVVYNESGIIGLHKQQKKFPSSFRLYQNYPNPFNSVTIIGYSIRKSTLVSIKLFNYLGQELKELVNDVKPAGEYEIKFDSKNLSSGIYFYRLSADNFIETKKMVLVK
jgi:ligand-binding sensor domain-containing protein